MGGVALFLAALFFSLNGGPGGSGPEPKAGHGESVGSVADGHGASSSDEDKTGRTRGASDRRAKTDAERGPRFPLVDAVLDDDTLTNHDAALKLRDIVLTEAAPENERLEALAHGLNLDFMAFKGIAVATVLPESVAERYLTELSNQNDYRSEQVEGLLDLLGHPAEGIRSETSDRLAFLIENEELASSPERLKVAAREFLEKLKQAPPPVPVQDDPGAQETPDPASGDPDDEPGR